MTKNSVIENAFEKLETSGRKKTVIAVDNANTYCLSSYIDANGLVNVSRNDRNHEETPTLVFFPKDGGKPSVGDSAKGQVRLFPERVLHDFKPLLGTDLFAGVIDGNKITPKEATAIMIASQINQSCKAENTYPGYLIIGKPADFGDDQSRALFEAASMACTMLGIEDCDIDLVTEPEAAAINYFSNGFEGRLLVFDLGGGTFDLCVLQGEGSYYGKTEVKTLYHAGDANLGGRLFDERIVHWIQEKYAAKYGSKDFSGSQLAEMNEIAERAKLDLSSMESVTVVFTTPKGTISEVLTRAEFESMTKDLVEKTIKLTRSVLSNPNIKGNVDKILVTGGATQMPMIETALKSLDIPLVSQDRESGVAKGLAKIGKTRLNERVNAGKINRDELLYKVPLSAIADSNSTVLHSCLPKSYGVESLRDGDKTVKWASLILQKGVEFPLDGGDIVNTRAYETVEYGQDGVSINMLESDSTGEWEAIDKSTVFKHVDYRFESPKPKGYVIEITTRVNPSGILSYTAYEPETGKKLELKAVKSIY